LYREHIEKFLDADKLEEIGNVLDEEFGELISQERRELIKRCLHLRQDKLREAITNSGRE
jgi:hypothetical protein